MDDKKSNPIDSMDIFSAEDIGEALKMIPNEGKKNTFQGIVNDISNGSRKMILEAIGKYNKKLLEGNPKVQELNRKYQNSELSKEELSQEIEDIVESMKEKSQEDIDKIVDSIIRLAQADFEASLMEILD